MSTSKKIGITTYWETNDNYGQLIQCWALQQYLRKKGQEPYLIRYHFLQPKANKIKRIKAFVKKCIADALFYTGIVRLCHLQNKLTSWTNIDLYCRKFNQFRDRYIEGSPKEYKSYRELQMNPPKADVYVTGSDQVWNYDMDKKHWPVYYLQFGDEATKRVSYAPSIGHADIPTDLQEEIKRYLDSFDAISVRETSAAPIIKDMGHEVTTVIDPSMLLRAEDYEPLYSQRSSKEGVFIYSMNYESRDSIPFDAIKNYASSQSIPIVVTPGSGWLGAKELFEDVKYSYATMPQWLSNIARARLVVTASFHGIVFAILFHRPFIYTPLQGSFSGGNNRILDLLTKIGLKERVVKDEESFSNAIQTNIVWDKVDAKLDEYRQVSYRFIEENIMV